MFEALGYEKHIARTNEHFCGQVVSHAMSGCVLAVEDSRVAHKASTPCTAAAYMISFLSATKYLDNTHV